MKKKDPPDGQELRRVELSKEESYRIARSQVENSRHTIAQIRRGRKEAALKSKSAFVGLKREL